MSHLAGTSNMTTRPLSQLPRPDLHRQDTQPYGLRQNEPKCAGKAGEVLRMKESNDQGPANRIGPESCVGVRKDAGEALTGVRAGRPLSPERTSRAPTLFWVSGRPHRTARQGESRPGPAGPREPEHARTHLAPASLSPQAGEAHAPHRKPGDPCSGLGSGPGPHRESLTGARR
jgi:hypothetical protein